MKRSFGKAFPRRVKGRRVRRRRLGGSAIVVGRRVARYPRPMRGSYPGLPLQGFPMKKAARLRYVDTFALNPGAGLKSVYVFRANDCYDPNLTGTGHQPKGFDQMMALYNHCTVIGSRITIRAYNQTPTVGPPGMIVCKLSASGTEVAATTNLEDLLEDPRLTGRKLGGAVGYSTGKAGANMIIVSNKFSARRFFGKKFIVGDALYRHTNAASPTEQAYFEICYHSLNGNDPDAITITVQIDYISVFTEPKPLGMS